MITVVISSYNYGHLAAHCIESILSQSVKPEKILFVDDGIGDCFELSTIYPEIDFTFRQQNLGTVDNFQDMLSKVTTKYCMFIGADNWLRSDTMSMFHNVIQLYDPDIITYDIMLTGERKETRVHHHKDEMYSFQGDYLWSRDKKHHGSMLYKVELAKSVGGYARLNQWSHQTQEDFSLWNRMIGVNANVIHIPHALLYYRHHRENYNQY